MNKMTEVFSIPPPSTERCRQLLQRWRADVQLSHREQGLLADDLTLLDQQLKRLEQRRLHIAVFGRVGVGKSSLINAFLGKQLLATDVAHGSTSQQRSVRWPIAIPGLGGIELIDTPGIDDIQQGEGRHQLAMTVAMEADLVLLVVDSDLTRIDRVAIDALLANGKPFQLVLNRSDRWHEQELPGLIATMQSRLPVAIPITAVAAAPRRPVLDAKGRPRSERAPAQITTLHQHLRQQLLQEGDLLLTMHALRRAHRFQETRQQLRLRLHRRDAQGLIGSYAAAKATGVAINPVLALDLAGGMALDTAMVMQLCRLYDLPMGPASARRLLRRLSSQNALLGGIQLGLSGLKQLLLMAAPFSGGISLAPAAPVAIAQAALAVHTSRRTGALVARLLLHCRGGQPGALLQRLERRDPVVRHWLKRWPLAQANAMQPLLP